MERDYFMSPGDARAYGLIDMVVEPKTLARFGGRRHSGRR
jgi:ATP-dependent protease ClpP protease subunit